MHRRGLLKLGLGAAVVLTAAGGAVTWLVAQPARNGGRFEPDARALLMAVGAAVLAGLLPASAAPRQAALNQWLERLEATVAGLPASVQMELDQLLLILQSAPGRLALARLRKPWQSASPQEVQAALQGMRLSGLAVRQQVFHALRDLGNAAYFASPQTWSALGYPGPPKV